MEIYVGLALGFVAAVLLHFGYAWLLSGGDFQRFGLARQVARRILQDAGFATQANLLLNPPPPKVEKPSAQPLWLLTLLQREGRLLDFLLEDIHAYANEQIGAAVRDIHVKCQKAIKEHLVLEPVLKNSEGDSVNVPLGFDPSAIRLTGNVTGQPPFKGTLQHHGWRVAEIKLASPPEGQDQFVVQPAEVELP
jgi:Domain of unknown function (DUF2760)